MRVLYWPTALVIVSCIPQNGVETRRDLGGSYNAPSSVSPNHGRLLEDNPIILSNNPGLEQDTDLNAFLSGPQKLITTNQFLISPCGPPNNSIKECIEVKDNELAEYLTKNDGTWAWSANSNEFLQVNTFGHIKKILDNFQKNLFHSWHQGIQQSYHSSLPQLLYGAGSRAFWFARGYRSKLRAYSSCDYPYNAYYDPADNSICLGYDGTFPQVKFAQDPTIIYHEMGHAFAYVMLNLRNKTDPNVTLESDLGYLFYDEAGAIGEGVSDYFSFVMNKRTHFGEWALGRFQQSSRPLSEDDPLHINGLSKDRDARLSYPTYLHYDPNNPHSKIEDIHYAGQIISHYLVALTEDLQDHCKMNREESTRGVLRLLFETFAELGTQTGRVNDYSPVSINLDRHHAAEWISTSRPINYRSFAQTMAKYIHEIYSNPLDNQCNNGTLPQDNIESLLDSYGLLLFKSYNKDGNGHELLSSGPSGRAGPLISIEPYNQKQSILIPKELLKISPIENTPSAFIFDNPQEMLSALQNMQSGGQIGTISPQIESGLPFNNSNGRISPGEFVGISLNLYNDSNSSMGGIQVLANDWDQAKNGKPCNIFEDQWPSEHEGAADSGHESGHRPGECQYITRQNGGETNEVLHPVCWIQDINDNATQWIGQRELMNRIGMDSSLCLGGSGKTQDCFIRSARGADHSFFSKINAKSTFAQTFSPEGNTTFNYNNLIFFEVSPWIPPGTTFNCRLRARFTNCEDCWSDPDNGHDDYLDYEYSGAKPFKILHLNFTVID